MHPLCARHCLGDGDTFGNKNNINPCMTSESYILGSDIHNKCNKKLYRTLGDKYIEKCRQKIWGPMVVV